MALEDFTTWVEWDPYNRIFITSEMVDVDNSAVGSPPRVYKDFGLDYFNGDFTIDFEFQIGNGHSTPRVTALCDITKNLQNNYFLNSPGIHVGWHNSSGVYFSINCKDWYTTVGFISQSLITRETVFYGTVEQATSGGLGYGFAECRIFSDASRTIHVTGSPLRHEFTNEQGQYDLPDSFQYLYAFSIQGGASGVADTTRWRFDINVGAPDNIYDGANLRAGFIRSEAKRAFPRLEVERGYLRHLVERGFIRNEVKRGFKRKGIA